MLARSQQSEVLRALPVCTRGGTAVSATMEPRGSIHHVKLQLSLLLIQCFEDAGGIFIILSG